MIYAQPRDIPEPFVVRVWYGATPGELIGAATSLEMARDLCQGCGASALLARHQNDDPVIVETWI